MDYVAGEELGNLVRLGIVFEVHFAYAVRVRSVQHTYHLLNMFNVPSMMYATPGPGEVCAGTGTPTVSSPIAAIK